jgi:hypothetical protein
MASVEETKSLYIPEDEEQVTDITDDDECSEDTSSLPTEKDISQLQIAFSQLNSIQDELLVLVTAQVIIFITRYLT